MAISPHENKWFLGPRLRIPLLNLPGVLRAQKKLCTQKCLKKNVTVIDDSDARTKPEIPISTNRQIKTIHEWCDLSASTK